jgi:hypothetical protein
VISSPLRKSGAAFDFGRSYQRGIYVVNAGGRNHELVVQAGGSLCGNLLDEARGLIAILD